MIDWTKSIKNPGEGVDVSSIAINDDELFSNILNKHITRIYKIVGTKIYIVEYLEDGWNKKYDYH